MRTIKKFTIPAILQDKGSQWLKEYLDDPNNLTKKTRYRHPEIKQALIKETGSKCVYCESKIGHNTPGDVEHKTPSSKVPTLHYSWENMTIACSECNRRKNDYYSHADGFVDPYVDLVEEMFEHHGPIVLSKTGCKRAEIAVRQLELSSSARFHLVSKKIEKIEQVCHVLERIKHEGNAILKDLLIISLKEMANSTTEFSAMVLTVLEHKAPELEWRG